MAKKPKVRLVGVHFSFSNINDIPTGLPPVKEETSQAFINRLQRKEKDVTRFSRVSIQPTPNSSVLTLVEELLERNYGLVDVITKLLVDTENNFSKRPVVEFIFAPAHMDQATPEFVRRYRQPGLSGLKKLASTAMWQASVRPDPYFEDGMVIDDHYVVNVFCNSRKPLLKPDGTSILVCRIDENGCKIRGNYTPLKPEWELRVKAGNIVLVPYGSSTDVAV